MPFRKIIEAIRQTEQYPLPAVQGHFFPVELQHLHPELGTLVHWAPDEHRGVAVTYFKDEDGAEHLVFRALHENQPTYRRVFRGKHLVHEDKFWARRTDDKPETLSRAEKNEFDNLLRQLQQHVQDKGEDWFPVASEERRKELLKKTWEFQRRDRFGEFLAKILGLARTAPRQPVRDITLTPSQLAKARQKGEMARKHLIWFLKQFVQP
ncbi:hypothetical protein HY572_03235 [Candidatus Micrarchaeota archaeon]|nr:hypothetical protein [Candidatus Micrarchaeota archaeon]